MGIFGWSYPPGADDDPQAPYNQDAEGDGGDVEKINSLHDLGRICFGTDTGADAASVEGVVSKRLFRDTECGCSFVHDAECIIIFGVCEGSEGYMPPHRLVFPFTEAEFWKALEEADMDGCIEWNNTHGCEHCWPDGCFDETGQLPIEFGDWPINPECTECGGNGVVL